ncbi:MAG: SPOR domain-containing protein [Treponema sp.]|jgi:hypothetical protein|nr:SPOR domain-containing protein [Treponema sp.]
MKIWRFFFVLLGGLLGNAIAFAQMEPPTLQGTATQEMAYEGFAAAAPGSYPLDSKITITNTKTGDVIEAAVTDHIPSSPDRVVDLSFDAWVALDLDIDTVVSISAASFDAVVLPSAAVPPPPETSAPARQSPAEPASPQADRGNISQALYHLLVLDRVACAPDSDISGINSARILYRFKHGRNGYLVALYTSQDGPVFPIMPESSRILVNASAAYKLPLREYVNSSAFRRFVTHRAAISQLQKLLQDINTVPALPSADSGKTYRIQVGAFANPESASLAAQRLVSAGFSAGEEQHGSLRRVLAEAIPASDVAAAVKKLELAGFNEVWIRE